MTPLFLPIWSWRKPNLAAEQEAELAKTVSQLGEPHFLKQFRVVLGYNPLSPPSELKLELNASENATKEIFSPARSYWLKPFDFIIVGASGLLCIACSLYVGDIKLLGILFLIFAAVFAIYFISLWFAYRSYSQWIEHLAKKATRS